MELESNSELEQAIQNVNDAWYNLQTYGTTKYAIAFYHAYVACEELQIENLLADE